MKGEAGDGLRWGKPVSLPDLDGEMQDLGESGFPDPAHLLAPGKGLSFLAGGPEPAGQWDVGWGEPWVWGKALLNPTRAMMINKHLLPSRAPLRVPGGSIPPSYGSEVTGEGEN